MKRSQLLYEIACIGIMLLFLGSCSGLKKLKGDERLYTGTQLVIDSKKELPKQAKLKNDLLAIIRPKPNTRFLGMRPSLAIHNMVKEPKKEKGFKHWLKYKVGSPPVLLKDVAFERMSLVLENHLFNSGYFDAEVDYEIIKDPKKPKASVKYTAHLHQPYQIDSINYPSPTDTLSDLIGGFKNNSLLKEGQIYSLNRLKDERRRITDSLKNKGYYFFAPEFLLFDTDTTVGGLGKRKVFLNLKIKENVTDDVLKPYTMRNVHVLPDYYSEKVQRDTIIMNNYHFVTRSNLFRPSVLLNAVFLEKGKYYSKKNHLRSIRYLEGMEMFRLVNSTVSRTEDSSRYELDASFLLTPKNSASLRTEVGFNSKSNSFVGPEVDVSLTNRNIFHGAEQLVTRLNTQYLVQVATAQRQGDRALEFELDATLLIPRIWLLDIRKQPRNFVPFTKVRLAGRYFNRLRFYALNSITASYGYNYKYSSRSYFEITPINIDEVNLTQTTADFDTLLDANPSLRVSFEEQFIVGSQLTYFYNNFVNRKTRNHIAYTGLIDLSGNLLYLLNTVFTGEAPTPDDQFAIFNLPVSQFSRQLSDFRYYRDFRSDRKLANRFIFGLAVPYGNSSVLPYVKRFFSGGINSVRAFEVRSLGPGTFQPDPEAADAGAFLQQVGDIKLEFNTEYRFPMISYLKGAVFIDVGNIWLLSPDPDTPGGEFEFDTFISQLAIGTGYGFRLDLQVVVVRLDVAFPLRKPFLPAGERWVFNEIDPISSAWWNDEVIFNFAIGYPF